MLDAETESRVRAAFPSTLGIELDAVVRILPPSTYPVSPDDVGEIFLGGEPIHIPARLYLPTPERGVTEALSRPQCVAHSCIYTRHHDGHVRESALRAILYATDEWVPPFIIQLVGEYVIEIVEAVLAHLECLATPAFRRFVSENPAFLAKTRARAISYWSCYHRRTARRQEDYAGVRVLDELLRLGAA